MREILVVAEQVFPHGNNTTNESTFISVGIGLFLRQVPSSRLSVTYFEISKRRFNLTWFFGIRLVMPK